MALNSEVHPNVPTIDEQKREYLYTLPSLRSLRKLLSSREWEEEWRRMREERRKLLEEKRKGAAWQAMQSKPTVDQINELNWFPVCHKLRSMGESLGISKGVVEEIIRTTVLFPGLYCSSLCDRTRCIKAMLVKWLNKDQGTGDSERTWFTIATAVKNAGLGDVAFELLEEVVKKLQNSYNILQIAHYGTPTLQDLKETIVHHLGEEWRSVGDSLGMSPKVKEEISSKFGSVPTHCSEAMFSKWLNHEEGTGHKERTWGTVLTALEDAGRGDLTFSVLDKLTVKHKEEEALKKAPNIKEIEVLVIPHMARMWRAIGRFLGIVKAILTAIESEARKKVSLKQTCEMFQLWLDGREGTGDEDRSWLVILRVLVDIGRSDIKFEIQGHFDLKTKDIARILSLLCDDTQSSSDDIPVSPTTTTGPTTSQVSAETSLECPPLNDNVGQVSLHDCIEVDGEVEEGKGCYSKSLSESSGSEVYTDPLPRLGSKRSCSEGSMGESSLATVEGLDKRGKFPSNQHAGSRRRQKWKKLIGLSNKLGYCSKSLSESSGSEVYTDPLPRLGSKRSCSEGSMGESSHATVEGLDKRGKFPSNLPAGSRRRQKWKKLNGLSNKLGLDKRRNSSVILDLPGKSRRRKKRTRRCLSGKLGHSRKHPTDQPRFSGQKRSPKSGDLEESGHKKRSYNKVSVDVVIGRITHKKLHGGIMGMLNGQRIRLLCDDWKLINQKYKNIILGLEKRNEIEEAADQLIDYFQKTHTGKQLLMFTRFLRKEAEDDGENEQLLNLAESIEEAVHSP